MQKESSTVKEIVFDNEMQSCDCLTGLDSPTTTTTTQVESNVWLNYYLEEQEQTRKLSTEIKRLNGVIDLLVRGYNHEIARATNNH